MSAKAAHQPAPSYGFAPQSTDGVMVEIQRLNRDHVLTRMGLHGHTFFELIYFERGGRTHALGGVRSSVEQGSLFVICPGELHDCTRIGRAEGWVLLFTRSALEQSPESLAFSREWLPRHPLFDPFLSLAIRSRNPLRIPNQDWPRWSQRLTSLDGELRNKSAHYRHASRALLHLILVDLARLLEPAELAIDDQRCYSWSSLSLKLDSQADIFGRRSARCGTQPCLYHYERAPQDGSCGRRVDCRAPYGLELDVSFCVDERGARVQPCHISLA